MDRENHHKEAPALVLSQAWAQAGQVGGPVISDKTGSDESTVRDLQVTEDKVLPKGRKSEWNLTANSQEAKPRACPQRA